MALWQFVLLHLISYLLVVFLNPDSTVFLVVFYQVLSLLLYLLRFFSELWIVESFQRSWSKKIICPKTKILRNPTDPINYQIKFSPDFKI
jgi:isoprenylcysteine carboxyl methyltransferase (ICMT) family protein YpbQ